MEGLLPVSERLKPTAPLTTKPLFRKRPNVTREEAFKLSYERVRALGQHYGLPFSHPNEDAVLRISEGFNIDDILELTPRFWDMHKDGIMLNDIGAHAMLSIQYNLVVGTIAPYTHQHPDIDILLQKLMDFDIS